MMLLCTAILFGPFDVQTAFYIFGFQSLVQLAGFAAEVIRGTEITDVPSRKFSLSRPVFYSAAAYYLLPWTLLFYLFWVSGYTDIETQTIPGPGGVLVELENEPATPPLQVTFFLGWLFSSFSLFPIVMWFKINSSGAIPDQFEVKTSSDSKLFVWNYRYEILFGVLSFVSKIPLQVSRRLRNLGCCLDADTAPRPSSP